MRGLIGGGSVFGIILSLVVVVFALLALRLGNATPLEQILQLGVCFSVVWAFISLWAGNRSARQLGAQITPEFSTGPRPEDQDELRVWRWGRQLGYALIVTVLFMGAFGLLAWLRGE
jgi:hypothetical protein